MTTIGSVDIAVRASTAKLDGDLNRATNKVKNFGSSAANAGSLTSRFGATIARGRVSIGAFASQLTRMGPAALAVGVSLGVLAKITNTIADSMKNAGQYMLKALDISKQLGVSVASLTGGLFDDKQAESVNELSKAWGRVQAQITRIAGTALAAIAPELTRILNGVAKILSLVSRPMIEAFTLVVKVIDRGLQALLRVVEVIEKVFGKGSLLPELPDLSGAGGNQFATAAQRGSQEAISAINRFNGQGTTQSNPQLDEAKKQTELLDRLIQENKELRKQLAGGGIEPAF